MKRLMGARVAAILACFASLSSAGQDVDGNPVLVLGDSVPIDSPKTYLSELHSCPAACSDLKPERWNVYSSFERLQRCDQPILFDFALYTPIQPGDSTKVRACTLGDEIEGTSEEVEKRAAKRATPICLSTASESKTTLQLGRHGSADSKSDETIAALEHLQSRFGEEASCDASAFFGYANGTIAGVYVGSAFSKASASSVLGGIIANVKADGSSTSMTSQLCDDDRNANHILGVAIDTTGDLAKIQEKIVSWTEGGCVADVGTTVSLKDLSIWEDDSEPVLRNNSTRLPRNLNKRADCETVTVVGGDSCAALASRCGLTAAEFTKLHPETDFCSTLAPEQRVCCTSGDLPDIRPKPNDDGTCATYYVIPGDNCATLAAKNGLTIDDIDGFNNGTTWGWTGCQTLGYGINICLSDGDPPMPAPVENAVCGPTKPDSKAPTGDTKLEDINPCPLNACCNIWGQCGISGDFCVKKDGPSGNPGTAPKGFNGCVSSCGMDIVNNDQSGGFGRVGYYESWNWERPCLNMRVVNANTDGTYTYIHWAFAEIETSNWTVKIVDTYNQWEDFKSMPSVKKIISLGGWGYSTEPETWDVLRQAMSPENRDVFSTNVAKFVSSEGLDGVDFDWEYPGAPDIPGVPVGLATDGPNYLKFLTTLRGKMTKGPDGKTVSIAAPASYWYLKQFPIDKMADVVDYIVYMTYDLHGQWDAGNEFSSEGCTSGNCLRSHVNLTETMTSLAMITKAGVPTYKIFVGESSYGRSFKMSEAGCTGPDCTFLGDHLNSPAAPGRCTNTNGYISNAEINDIINFGNVTKQWHDGGSNSDMLVYDDTEWVAYMTYDTRNTRRTLWQGYNFAGTIDWAVDLQEFTDDDLYGPDDDRPTDPTPEPLTECDGEYTSLDDIPDSAPDHCRNLYILQALRKTLSDSLTQYDDLVGGGYDKKFDTYASAVAKSGNKQVEDFMYTKGNDYFTCIVTEQYGCCKWCDYYYPNGDDKQCRYCENYDCGWSLSCDNPRGIPCQIDMRFRNISMPCPPDFSLRSEEEPDYDHGGYATASVYWTLRDDRADAFWGDLYLDTGIDEDNIQWKSVERYPCIPAESDAECARHDHDHNFPVTHDYNKDDVLDPKDVVENAYANLQGLGPQLDDVIAAMKGGSFYGSGYDVVDAVGLPITMVDDAVDNMQTIDDTVDKWDAQKRKNILLAFLSAIFFFVPVIGEVLATVATLANVARIVALIGATGNIALGIYDIVDDPANAPLAIFGIILEPFALMDVAKMTKAAAARRLMSTDDIKKLGDKPSGKIDKIESIKNICVLPKRKRDLPRGTLPMSSLTGREYDLMDGMIGLGI